MEILLENLERTSQNWDNKTKNILLFIGGAGNMFGGHGRSLHIVLHGNNSITPQKIEIIGVVTTGYNISRGANGDSSENLSYYKGVSDFDSIEGLKPTYKITVDGSCGGTEAALCQMISATKDFFVKTK